MQILGSVVEARASSPVPSTSEVSVAAMAAATAEIEEAKTVSVEEMMKATVVEVRRVEFTFPFAMTVAKWERDGKRHVAFSAKTNVGNVFQMVGNPTDDFATIPAKTRVRLTVSIPEGAVFRTNNKGNLSLPEATVEKLEVV